MDAFESVVALTLRRRGYWTVTSLKVELTKADKSRIKRVSSPRWEIDVVAYRPQSNEILAVECKSFLDSPGVTFNGKCLMPKNRYKLFHEPTTRRVVLRALVRQLEEVGLCRPRAKVTLCLAVGKLRPRDDREALHRYFQKNGWHLITPQDIAQRLKESSESSYENDIAIVVAKLMGRQAARERRGN